MEQLEQQAGVAGKIEAIDKSAVHRICSGQVVLTLATAVKELVENSLDAGASCIDVRLKNYGIESIEVIDNGTGVEECNFQALNLTEVTTFGFRGEALSSLCALSKVSVTTFHKNSTVGSKLQFDHNGKLTSVSASARQIGTTVLVEDLFSTLPVRHKEFQRNIKKEFVKMVQTMTSYCLMSINVKITCSNQMENSKRTTVLSIPGNPSVKENIINVFGVKQVNSLVEFQQSEPTEDECLQFDLSKIASDNMPSISLTGFISSAVHGEGRSSADRQFYYINRRPCDPTKIMRLINDIYHTYNRHQYPFVALNLQIDTDCADINVTPDKRQILLQHEKLLLATIKASLIRMYESSSGVGFSIGDTRDASSVFRRQSNILQSPLMTRNRQEQESVTPVLSLANLKRSYSSSFAKSKTPAQESSIKQKKMDEFVPKNSCVEFCVTRDEMCVQNDDIGSENIYSNGSDTCIPTNSKSPEHNVSDTIVSHNGLAERSNLIFVRDVPKHETDPVDRIDMVNTPEQDIFLSNTDIITRNRVDTPSVSLGDQLNERSNTSFDRRNVQSKHAKFASGPNQLKKVSLSNCKDSETADVELPCSVNPPAVESYKINDDVDSLPANEMYKSIMLNEENSGTQKKPTNEDSQTDSVNNNVIWDLSADSTSCCRQDDLSEISFMSCDRNLGADLDVCDDSSSVCEISTKMAEFNSASVIEVDVAEPIASKRCVVLQFSMTQLKKSLQFHQRRSIIGVGRHRTFLAKISPTDNQAAEAELQKELKKDHFKKMEIIGQFNLGFIIGRLGSDLFIIDQHATDEKYNFETMQRNTSLQGQKLIQPINLNLTAVNESILLDNLEIFRKNGFDFQVDLNAMVQQRALLTCIPVSGNWSFSQQDIEEMLFMLSDSPGVMCRPSRVRAMFASRACRSSVMIGTALNKSEMKRLLIHMGEIDQPWNCPHGRPTIRHLFNLDMLT